MMEFKFDKTMIKAQEEEEESPAPKHKGLYYRGRVSYYYSESSGEFHKKVGLKPLRRKSCKGCPTYDAIFESIHDWDALEEILDGVEDGKMYKLGIESL